MSTNDPQGMPPYDAEPPLLAEVSSQSRTAGMLCHLSAFAGYVVPFGNIAGPLIVWLIKKDEDEFVDFHGKESLNFQLTMTIAFILSGILILALVGIVLLPMALLFDLIMKVVAAVKASNGEFSSIRLQFAS